jgi:hypothetical protein
MMRQTAQTLKISNNCKNTLMNTMNLYRTLAVRPRAGNLPVLYLLAGLLAVGVAQAADLAATNTPGAIPWNQIGARAGANYKGDGLAVSPAGSGAHLHCVFQRLDGEATPEGLWLSSTVTNAVRDYFHVMAMAVSRTAANATFNFPSPESSIPLAGAGEVSICGQTVRFSRAGLTEEYSVSMDGVRQDFIVEQSPSSPPDGDLVVKLAVSGAQVEPAADGARLVLDSLGRKIAYSRLRVTDATGKELPARMEVSAVVDGVTSLNSWIVADNMEEPSLLTPAPAREDLALVVDDADAVYPVRIDPTFSDANWVSMGGVSELNYFVMALAVSGSTLYAGGYFTTAGGSAANYIAQWNGSSWSALGSGISGEGSDGYGPNVNALAVSGSTLYAGGDFSTAGGSAANNIAEWNGTSWSALGSGMNSNVRALAVSGSTLYAGGYFTTAGGGAANYIAQWNGSSWSALASGVSGGDAYGPYVQALAVSGSTLYAGGDFTTAGGSSATNIAQWNGSSWSALGSGMNDAVLALAVSGSTLYAGGQFSSAGGNAAICIAQWNGSSWSALGSGMNGDVYALAVSGSTLYVGGGFTTAGGISANNTAQWNGTSWSALGSGISGDDGNGGPNVYALAVSGSTLYAGGYFSMAGGSAANYVAQWNGSSWLAPGSGLNNPVYALAVSGSTLYAGGYFSMAGGSAANYVAQWNGSSWSSLGSGISGVGDGYGPYVSALAVSGGTLYAGGDFTTAGAISADYIAKWNGSSWSALSSGMNGAVFALAVSGSTLYAGGDFTRAGRFAANYIAKWNGSSWLTLGSGLNSTVNTLAVSGSTLYAGGYFTTAGTNAANYIAQWNGSSWSALGSGISGIGDGSGPYVEALAVSGGTLYVGGDFTTAGAISANYIAQWNGSSWSALSSGMNSYVSALAVSGGTLYAGGYFTTAGGISANYIAQWNGSSWSALGSGLNYDVTALAVSGSSLYAGGEFTTAGTNASFYAAMANLADTPVSFGIIATNAAFGFTGGVFGFDVTGPSGSNLVIQASTDLQTWIPLQTNLLGGGPLYFSDSQSPANVLRFYRAQLSP